MNDCFYKMDEFSRMLPSAEFDWPWDESDRLFSDFNLHKLTAWSPTIQEICASLNVTSEKQVDWHDAEILMFLFSPNGLVVNLKQFGAFLPANAELDRTVLLESVSCYFMYMYICITFTDSFLNSVRLAIFFCILIRSTDCLDQFIFSPRTDERCPCAL